MTENEKRYGFLDPDCCLGCRTPHDPHAPVEGWAAFYVIAAVMIAVAGLVIYGATR